MVRRRDRSEWFPLVSREWMTDAKVRALPLDERALLVDLWCICWTEGGIPDDIDTIARLIGQPAKALRRAWPRLAPFFVERAGDRLTSRRLESERMAVQMHFEQRRLAAGSRWQRAPRDAESAHRSDAKRMRPHASRICEPDATASPPHMRNACETDAAASVSHEVRMPRARQSSELRVQSSPLGVRTALENGVRKPLGTLGIGAPDPAEDRTGPETEIRSAQRSGTSSTKRRSSNRKLTREEAIKRGSLEHLRPEARIAENEGRESARAAADRELAEQDRAFRDRVLGGGAS